MLGQRQRTGVIAHITGQVKTGEIIDAKQILFPVIRSCIEQQSLPSFHQELPIEPARFQGRNVMGGVALIKQALLEGNLLLRIMEM